MYKRAVEGPDVQNVLHPTRACRCGSGRPHAECHPGPLWAKIHGKRHGRQCSKCPTRCIGLACIDMVRVAWLCGVFE